MKIQLKRSNVLDGGKAKEPTAAQMEYGELAVNYSEDDPAVFLKDSNDAVIRIAGSGAEGSDLQSVTDKGNTTTNGATFAGTVQVGPGQNTDSYHSTINPGGVYVYTPDGTTTTPVFLVKEGADTSVEFTGEGAASFAGQVDCSSDGNNVASLVSNGYFQSARTLGTSSVLEGQLNGTSTVSIIASGAATFAGYIISNRYAESSGLSINYNGTDYGYALYDQTKLYAGIALDGAATFRGRTNCGATSLDDYAVAAFSNSAVNGGFYSQNDNASGRLFVGQSPNGEVIAFEASGAATFAGTVTANGTVLTRASGNLDVGDRLEKADAALQTLKTAAAASTDFASLKSAIATALANI